MKSYLDNKIAKKTIEGRKLQTGSQLKLFILIGDSRLFGTKIVISHMPIAYVNFYL